MEETYHELDPRGDIVLVVDTHAEDIAASHRLDWDHLNREILALPIKAANTRRPILGSVRRGAKTIVGKSKATESNSRYIKFQASSSHLRLASPYFERMLFGKWLESNHSNPGITRDVTISNCDPDALLIVLNIIHGHIRKIPRNISWELLTEVAVIADFYDCVDSISVFVEIWVQKWVLRSEILRWLYISHALRIREIFYDVAGLFQLNAKVPLQDYDLPISQALLEAIDETRADTIQKIFSAFRRILESLQGSEPQCNPECDSFFLDKITKQLRRYGLVDLNPSPPFRGYTVIGLRDIASGIPSPRSKAISAWKDSHQCKMQIKISDDVRSVVASMKQLYVDESGGIETISRG